MPPKLLDYVTDPNPTGIHDATSAIPIVLGKSFYTLASYEFRMNTHPRLFIQIKISLSTFHKI